MTDEIAPFRIEVSDADIVDLDTRLALTRGPSARRSPIGPKEFRSTI